MSLNNRDGERGMTIVEILLSAGIGAFLLTSLATATGLFLDTYDASLDEQELSLTQEMAMKRILRTITSAADVDVASSTSIKCTLPDTVTESYTWSGLKTDPLLFTRNGGDDTPFLDGVSALSFEPVMFNALSESLVTESQQIMDFSTYTGMTQSWDDQTLAPGSQHGLTFRFFFVKEVEQIVLTDLNVRIGKFAGQTSDLKVTLYEGQDETRPRIWGDPLATCQVSNSAIPDAVDNGGQWEIGWMTISLPSDFVIQPNRFYCFLFEPVSSADAGVLRVAKVDGGTGPINDMAYMGTVDGGAPWEPPLKTQAYRDRDVPFQLFGDITTIVREVTPVVGVVNVTLSLFNGDVEVTGNGSARVRGGGELHLLP